ncbi:MAG: deoxyribose-phosphate aldolase [Methylotenera sp.]|nr:deoxyribose-phosphate aldolase [Oligoflexia bacterium]
MPLHDRDSKSRPSSGDSPISLNSLVESFIQTARGLLDSAASSSAESSTLAESPKSALSPAPPTSSSFAQLIDHTSLKADATPQDIQRLCEEARTHQFATVCVNSCYVGLAKDLLKGSSVKPISVVGFPLGVCTTETKVFETRAAIEAGAQEIDMVIHAGALKSKNYEYVFRDIQQVVQAAAPVPVKVILETSTLDLNQKIAGAALSKAAGAAFVKTSTGFASGGASVEDVTLLRKIVGSEMGVKASGGIRTFEDAAKMIRAGANRIGASASVAMTLQSSSSVPAASATPSTTPSTGPGTAASGQTPAGSY